MRERTSEGALDAAMSKKVKRRAQHVRRIFSWVTRFGLARHLVHISAVASLASTDILYTTSPAARSHGRRRRSTQHRRTCGVGRRSGAVRLRLPARRTGPSSCRPHKQRACASNATTLFASSAFTSAAANPLAVRSGTPILVANDDGCASHITYGVGGETDAACRGGGEHSRVLRDSEGRGLQRAYMRSYELCVTGLSVIWS
jgi:hypothetical protein